MILCKEMQPTLSRQSLSLVTEDLGDALDPQETPVSNFIIPRVDSIPSGLHSLQQKLKSSQQSQQLVQHFVSDQKQTNYFQEMPIDDQQHHTSDKSNKIVKNSDLHYCPHCSRPYLQQTFYFHMLNQSDGQAFSERYFEVLGQIGSGSFGRVLRVVHKVQDILLGEYALKQIAVGDTKPWLLKALLEVRVLEKLQHQNIVGYHYCWLENLTTAINQTDPIRHLNILLDYAKGGSLENLLSDRLGRRLTQLELLHLLIQASAGLQHLHSVGFLSRDVKPGNFLLTSAQQTDTEPHQHISKVFDENFVEPQIDKIMNSRKFKNSFEYRNKCRQLFFIRNTGILNLQVQLCDFGQMGEGASGGTWVYEAPEVQNGQKCTILSDVYGLGVTFLQLWFGIELTVDTFQDDLLSQLRNQLSKSNDALLLLLNSMLDVIAANRPSLDDIMKASEKLIVLIRNQENSRIDKRKQGSDRNFIIPCVTDDCSLKTKQYMKDFDTNSQYIKEQRQLTNNQTEDIPIEQKNIQNHNNSKYMQQFTKLETLIIIQLILLVILFFK